MAPRFEVEGGGEVRVTVSRDYMRYIKRTMGVRWCVAMAAGALIEMITGGAWGGGLWVAATAVVAPWALVRTGYYVVGPLGIDLVVSSRGWHLMFRVVNFRRERLCRWQQDEWSGQPAIVVLMAQGKRTLLVPDPSEHERAWEVVNKELQRHVLQPGDRV